MDSQRIDTRSAADVAAQLAAADAALAAAPPETRTDRLHGRRRTLAWVLGQCPAPISGHTPSAAPPDASQRAAEFMTASRAVLLSPPAHFHQGVYDVLVWLAGSRPSIDPDQAVPDRPLPQQRAAQSLAWGPDIQSPTPPR